MTKHKIADSASRDMRGWWGQISVIIVFFMLLVLCIKTSLAEETGTVLIVNSTLDERDAVPGDRACSSTPSGLCTLRAAVEEGQASNLAVSVPAGLYELSQALGQLGISRNLTLSGAGSGQTRIDGVIRHRVFDIAPGGFAYIEGVTIQWGKGEPGIFVPAHWHGGGIHNHGTLILVDSTVRASSAEVDTHNIRWGGGGIANAGGATATLVNVTLAGNAAWEKGGGIENNGTMDLYNVTVVSNQAFGSAPAGGGIFNGGTFRLRNTLIANNFSGGNCSGALDDRGYNLSSDGTCNFTGTGSRNNGDPRLGGRDENDTYPLFAGSQALDAGNPTSPAGGDTCTNEDQRGVSRPQDGDGNGSAICDIGAYELLVELETAIPSPTSTATATLSPTHTPTTTATPTSTALPDESTPTPMPPLLTVTSTISVTPTPTATATATLEPTAATPTSTPTVLPTSDVGGDGLRIHLPVIRN